MPASATAVINVNLLLLMMQEIASNSNVGRSVGALELPGHVSSRRPEPLVH